MARTEKAECVFRLSGLNRLKVLSLSANKFNGFDSTSFNRAFRLNYSRMALLAVIVSCLPVAMFASKAATTPTLGLSTTAISYGNVIVGQTASQPVVLTSTGTAPVTISGISIVGSLFTASGISTPLTLNPGQSATLTMTFTSPHVSSFTGVLTITSNSSTNPTAVVNMSASGVAGTSTLGLSTTNISFGNVTVGQAASQPVVLTSTGTAPVTISGISIAGSLFTASGITTPLTLNPGQSATLTMTFTSPHVSSFTGVLTITSNSSTNPTATVNMSGSGVAATGTLSALTCGTGSYTGAGADACTVTLSAPAGSSGLSVGLSSSSTSVTVPSSVTVAANATSAGFTATVASVSSAQTVTLTAAAGTVSKTFPVQLNAATPTLGLSTTTISYGNVTVGQTASQPVILTSTGTAPVTISGISIAGSLFTASGVTAPLTLNPGQSATLTMTFTSPHVSSFTGVLTITSNSSTNPTAVVNMSGSGVAAAGTLSALSCVTGSFTGAGTDACTVMLNAPAGSSGLSVALSSSSTSVVVPSSVTVPANATSAAFTATVSSVTSAQAVTLTAVAGTISKTFALQLSVGTSTLSVNATSVGFGNVFLNSPATQSITLTSTGTASVTISSGTITGTGFTMSGIAFPLTLNAGQTATLNIQFDPTTTGAAAGQVKIVSNSSTNPTSVISLSGTGEVHEVSLSWQAPICPKDPAVGYHVYRATGGGTGYQLLNSLAQLTYVDTTAVSGQSYNYVVKAVDASGVESVPSNTTSVTIP